MASPLPVQDVDRRRNMANAGIGNAFSDSCRILSYSKAKKHTPWLTPSIAVINIVVYTVVMFINNCPKTPAGQHGKCVPKFFGRFSYDKTTYGPTEQTLLNVGAILGNTIDHEKWKLFVSFWLHKNIFHLIVYSISLLIIGIPLELEFVRIAVIYILSGFGGSIFYAKLVPEFQAVCVSGPLFGLIGATLSDLLTNLLTNENESGRFWVVVSVIMVNTVGVVRGPPDNIFAGFVTGCLLSFVMLIRPQYESKKRQDDPLYERFMAQYDVLQIIYWVVSLILLVIEIVAAFVWVIGGFR